MHERCDRSTEAVWGLESGGVVLRGLGHPDLQAEQPRWGEFSSDLDLAVETDGLWALHYERLVDQNIRAAGDFEGALRRRDRKPRIGALARSGWERQIRDHLIDRRDRTVGVVEALAAELELATANRDRIGRPPGLILGLMVLGFLTVTTVVVPVLYLIPTPPVLSRREAVFVACVFFLGILVLFGYMVGHVAKLCRLSAAPKRR